MRDFYIYGFKTREDFNEKSLRSYDNEKRRIESYLSEYMSFSKDDSGKNIYIEADCGEISSNPLYRAFKAKSFTRNDITLNFIILDILVDDKSFTASEIANKIATDYLTFFEDPLLLDLSTVRNKLSEYEKLGLLISKKDGKKLLYSLNDHHLNIENIGDALSFFSETSPIGVVGSFLLDKLNYKNDILCFKHHYIMHALESEIVYDMLQAMKKKQRVKFTCIGKDKKNIHERIVIPLKILISVQSGRRYVSVANNKGIINNYRLDYIKKVIPLDENDDYDILKATLENMLTHTWGSSFGDGSTLENLRMILHIEHHESYILDRVIREGRFGTVKKIDDETYEYGIDVYDCMEMMPWIRTFIGRILSLEGTNKQMIDLFYDDLNKMNALYGGEKNDIL